MPVDVPLGEDEFRRSVYVEVRRSRPLAFLNAFDAPVMEVNCERRPSSTVAPQALMLMNSEFILRQAGLLADRVRRETGPGREPRIAGAWRLAYGRDPAPDETRRATEFLSRQVESLNTAEKAAPAESSPGRVPAEDRAFRNLCQALLASNEFLYVE